MLSASTLIRALGLWAKVVLAQVCASARNGGTRPSCAPQRLLSIKYLLSSQPWSGWAPSLVSSVRLDCMSYEAYFILGLTAKPQSMPASVNFLAGFAGPQQIVYSAARPVMNACSLLVVPTSTPGDAIAAPSFVVTSAQRSEVWSSSL